MCIFKYICVSGKHKIYKNFLDVPHKAYRVSQLNAASSRTPVAQLFVYFSKTSKTQVGAVGDELQIKYKMQHRRQFL